MSVRVAIDCMGGDHGLPVTIPAALSFLRHAPDARLLLVGLSDRIEQALVEAGAPASSPLRDRLEIRHASEVVEMDDSLQVALRGKRDSSMRVAVGLLRDGQADVCVSAGNTGALMAVSRFVLKTLEGIDRPAIATQMPNRTGGTTTVLDLGANVDCEPGHYLQFGIMGSALVSALGGADRPTVGLLNIGEEVIKGNEVIKQAGVLLRRAAEHGDLNFYGNVEGNDLFKGTVDIVVCDGFVGNVVLKASEGLASMIGGFVREEFSRSWYSQLAAALAWPVLSSFKERVDHRRYNGAALLGLRGLVFKSHGSADAVAFEQALRRAYEAADKQLLQRVQERIAAAAPLAPLSPA